MFPVSENAGNSTFRPVQLSKEMPLSLQKEVCYSVGLTSLSDAGQDEGFDTSRNPVRQCRNKLETTQKINGNQLEIGEKNQKSQKIKSGVRKGIRSNWLINRFVASVAT